MAEFVLKQTAADVQRAIDRALSAPDAESLNLLSSEFDSKLDDMRGYLPIGENAGYFLMADENGNIRSSGVPVATLNSNVVKSWKDVQNIVRSGIASEVFNIGDRFTCSQNNRTLTWEIIGFDQDTPSDTTLKHSLTLQLSNLFVRYVQYDGEELLWRNPEPIVAGSSVSVTTGSPRADGLLSNNTTYIFVVDKDVPEGCEFKGKIVSEQPTIYIYNGLTLLTSVTNPTAIKSTESIGISPYRIESGYGSWKHSAIRQWLNSSSQAGSVWYPAHEFDGSPTWLNSEDGFLYLMDESFLDVVGKVRKKTWIQEDDSGSLQEDDELFFLPSAKEVGASSYGHDEEGECYQYYAAGSNNVRVKYLGDVAATYWLRTTYPSSVPHLVKVVRNTGKIESFAAKERAGVAPICNIV